MGMNIQADKNKNISLLVNGHGIPEHMHNKAKRLAKSLINRSPKTNKRIAQENWNAS